MIGKKLGEDIELIYSLNLIHGECHYRVVSPLDKDTSLCFSVSASHWVKRSKSFESKFNSYMVIKEEGSI